MSVNDLRFDRPVHAAIRRAGKMTLFEGLPHQLFEADLLEKELATKSTITIDGFAFYKTPLSVPGEEVELLRDLCGNWRNYSSGWGGRGGKYCGGFHPDYAMTWHDDSSEYHSLICFGCHEMIFLGPNLREHWDIRDFTQQTDPDARFAAILQKYKVQRPERGASKGLY